MNRRQDRESLMAAIEELMKPVSEQEWMIIAVPNIDDPLGYKQITRKWDEEPSEEELALLAERRQDMMDRGTSMSKIRAIGMPRRPEWMQIRRTAPDEKRPAVKYWMEKVAMSERELQDLTGVSRPTVLNWVSGRQKPPKYVFLVLKLLHLHYD